MERCTNANLSMFPQSGLICTKSEVMLFTRLRFVEFKEIVCSDGRMNGNVGSPVKKGCISSDTCFLRS